VDANERHVEQCLPRIHTNASPHWEESNGKKARVQLVIILDPAYIVPAHDGQLLRRWLDWLAARGSLCVFREARCKAQPASGAAAWRTTTTLTLEPSSYLRYSGPPGALSTGTTTSPPLLHLFILRLRGRPAY
jgi:hypothetical protein